MLIDTHSHLYWDSFKPDLDEVLKRAVDAGVNTIINVGVDIEKSQEALDQVKNTNWPSDMVTYSTIGIHPHESVKFSSDQIEKLEQIYKSDPEKVVAVGECGLDYVEVDEKEKELQKQLFQAQIDLAKKLNLPLIVHCRDDRSTPIKSGSKNPENSECWDEVINMTKDHFGIYHCYSGLSQTTNYILQNTKFLISFAATITYPKNEYLREAAKILPLERIVLETDCPFLPPQSKRGQRNEPSSILEIAQLIADIKNISPEEVASQTSANAATVFDLKPR